MLLSQSMSIESMTIRKFWNSNKVLFRFTKMEKVNLHFLFRNEARRDFDEDYLKMKKNKNFAFLTSYYADRYKDDRR